MARCRVLSCRSSAPKNGCCCPAYSADDCINMHLCLCVDRDGHKKESRRCLHARLSACKGTPKSHFVLAQSREGGVNTLWRRLFGPIPTTAPGGGQVLSGRADDLGVLRKRGREGIAPRCVRSLQGAASDTGCRRWLISLFSRAPFFSVKTNTAWYGAEQRNTGVSFF